VARTSSTTLHTVRVPLFEYPHTREETTSLDSYFKNCYPEKLIGATKEQTRFYVTKRPGIAAATYAQSSGTARGMYIWQGNVYYVIGNNIYKNGGASLGTITNSTGRVYFEVMAGGSTAEKLCLLDGSVIWTVKADDTLTETTADTPDAAIGDIAGGIANLDGYIFVCDDDGKILHNDEQNPTTATIPFANSNLLSANVFGDQLKGIVRHLNYIMAIGEWSTEFFYNAGNTSGSVLSRAEGTVLRYGTPCFGSVWQDENVVCWVARSRDGGNCVIVLDGLTPKIISTKPIEKLLNAETSLDDTLGMGFRLAGHIFYMIQLVDSDKTLVFSLTDNTWCEWTSYDGATEGNFIANDIKAHVNSSGTTQIFVLHESTGDVHLLDIDEYDDDGNTIKVKIVTDKIDFQTAAPKFLYRLILLGDLIDHTSAVNVSLRWTDDDYQNWSASYTRDMNYIPAWNACGKFNRRAFEITFENDWPMRLEAFEFAVKLGTYAQVRQ